MRKILSLLLILVIASTMMITVFADAPTVTISTVEADPGDTVQITVDLTNNPGFVVFSGRVTYDSNLTISKWAAGDYGNNSTATSTSAKKKNPFPFSVGDYGAEEDYADDGTICTFTFVVSESATPGTTLPVSLEIKDGETLNFDEQKISSQFTTVAGGVTVKGTPAPTTYTVTYDAGEGSNAPAADTNVAADTVIDLTQKAQPTAPSGKQFKGWSANGTDIITSLTVTGNVTLTALYEEIPVPTGPVLNGVATRLASSVAIDNVNHTVNVVYDTAQKVYLSTYVGFAPIVADGVEVTYSGADFREKVARLANYTVTTGTAANIDLLAEKTDKTKEAIDGYIYYVAGNAGLHNFAMILTEGDVSTEYAVNITLADLATEGNVITEEMANTEGFYKAGRKDDIVNIDTVNKVITLTTKNIYNNTTFALNAVALTGIETAIVRPRRTIEVVDTDNNIKYSTSSNSNLYDRGVLISYNEGETKEYTINIYGGENGMTYETYTLKVEYVSARDTEDITIHRVQAVENARANKAAEINENSAINVTYDAAYDNGGFAIKFVPIIIRGFTGEFIGGKGVTAAYPVCGAERPMYVIDDINDVDSFTYRVKYFRDYRDFAVNFIPKA